MKRILCIVCVLFALALAAGCQKSDKGKGIAVVDMARVQAQSQVLVKATDYLDKIKQDLISSAMDAEKAYQADPTPDKDKARQAAVTKLQSVLGGEQQRLARTLKAKMDAVLEDYRTAHGYTAILLHDTVMAYDPTLDITDDIVKAFDKVEISLTPPAEAEQPAAEAPAAPAEKPEAAAPAEKPAEQPEAAAPAAPAEKPAEAPAK
ncbi:MAG: OmpH family outer membrane protein [Desulfovibrionaceae bacterium]